MTRSSVASKVRERKSRHPELYCPRHDCLWMTGGGYCPRHGGGPAKPVEREDNIARDLAASCVLKSVENLAAAGVTLSDETKEHGAKFIAGIRGMR